MDIIEEKVRQLVANSMLLSKTELEKLNDKTKFWEDLSANGLDVYELIVETEITFDITIKEDERFSLKTFGELVELVKRKIKERARK